jgi:hypothetical protein
MRIKRDDNFKDLRRLNNDPNSERQLLERLIKGEILSGIQKEHNKTVEQICSDKGINIQGAAMYCLKSGTPKTLELFKSLIIEIN